MTTLAQSVEALSEHGHVIKHLGVQIAKVENPQTGFSRRLRRPLMLKAVWGGNYWVVSGTVSLAHGTAPALEEAVADYMRDWEERLRLLEDGEPDLSAPVLHELHAMRRAMVVVPTTNAD